MSFTSVYLQTLSQLGYQRDEAHSKPVEHLDRLYRDFIDRQRCVKGVLARFFCSKKYRVKTSRALFGCYLWGDVGRGKTWLMDLFYRSLPTETKLRLHFDDFMQRIHHDLKMYNGHQDPLVLIAQNLSTQTRIICLDEFHVDDIADAMILHGLLEAFYRHGIVMVMTSNIYPDELYRNGLQRSRFLPAIELIKQHNHILQVAGSEDYRKSSTANCQNYLSPLSPNTDLVLEQRFRSCALGEISMQKKLMIHNRPIIAKMRADNIVWFDFESLCGGPRAASDYLYLAENFKYIMVSNIYRMQDVNDDLAKRLIILVDTLYDRRIGLIISATASPENLYSGLRFTEEFKRTASRLEEMSSWTLSLNAQSTADNQVSNTITWSI